MCNFKGFDVGDFAMTDGTAGSASHLGSDDTVSGDAQESGIRSGSMSDPTTGSGGSASYPTSVSGDAQGSGPRDHSSSVPEQTMMSGSSAQEFREDDYGSGGKNFVDGCSVVLEVQLQACTPVLAFSNNT